MSITKEVLLVVINRRQACTKTRNNETKPPKRNQRNHRNERNERNETTETNNHQNKIVIVKFETFRCAFVTHYESRGFVLAYV